MTLAIFTSRRLAGLGLLIVSVVVAASTTDASAQQAIKPGDTLSGELRAMRARGPKGKRVNTFQLISQPRKLPGADGLCNLETGPETFQIVTKSDDEASQLKKLIGKTVNLKAEEMSCAQAAGQMSDAVVTKWRVATP